MWAGTISHQWDWDSKQQRGVCSVLLGLSYAETKESGAKRLALGITDVTFTESAARA